MTGDELRYDLRVDTNNIDRYLPPATEETDNEDEGSIDSIDLPLEPLRTFRARGTLALGQTQFMGMQFTDATFALNAANGQMTLTPSGSMYGGSINGEIAIQVQGDAARFSLEQRLANVDLNGLARDFLETEDLTGRGNVTLDLAATGSNVGALKRDLDGTASFALSDGAWQGIDVWYELRRARAVTGGNSAPAREGEPQTQFSNVSASGVVEDGLLTTSDLNATLPFAALNGRGTVNLLNDALDLTATAGFVDGPTLQSDPAMAELAGASLPLTITGTVAAPSIRPDFGALVRARVQREVDERIEEEREEVREELQDRVRDRLRGILDR
jgi:AsmA protein